MWSTPDGARRLAGDEKALVACAVRRLLGHIDSANRAPAAAVSYEIGWFDQWDPPQQVWLIGTVTEALFTDTNPPPPSAMLEATVDAFFREVLDQVCRELEGADLADDDPTHWRTMVIAAYRQQTGRRPQSEGSTIPADSFDPAHWHRTVAQIADRILGVRLYQKAETFRDADIETTRRFLSLHGLPDQFLQSIPPLRSRQQTGETIDRIKRHLT